MSAKILQFAPRARRERSFNGSANISRPKTSPDDLTMDHADTAPCECIGPYEAQHDDDEPA
jgi:hypothetical protein